LIKDGQAIRLQDWANDILNNMQAVCDILDENEAEDDYNQALTEQRKLIANPDLTPSAQILAKMRAEKKPFAHFAEGVSRTNLSSYIFPFLLS
jgi:glutamate--cysteine ligase